MIIMPSSETSSLYPVGVIPILPSLKILQCQASLPTKLYLERCSMSAHVWLLDCIPMLELDIWVMSTFMIVKFPLVIKFKFWVIIAS
jgi:hypothetical protein